MIQPHPDIDQVHVLDIDPAGGLDMQPELMIDPPEGVHLGVAGIGGGVGPPQPAGHPEI